MSGTSNPFVGNYFFYSYEISMLFGTSNKCKAAPLVMVDI